MRILHNIPSIFIFGFWLSMMGLLVQKEFFPENILPQKISFPKELPYVKTWGIYSQETRIGYLKNKIILEANSYLCESRAEIRLLEDIPISINATTVFGKDENLGNFKISITYKDSTVDLAGTVNADVIMPWFNIPSFRVGDKFQWYLLNPLTHTKDLVKAVVRRASFYYNRKDFVPAVVVDVYYHDMKFEFWVDREGSPLKVITPWGWELEAE